MSKMQDQMRALLGKYSTKKVAARPAPRKNPAPARTPPAPAARRPSPSQGSPLPGFHMETLRGVVFLVSNEHPHYAAYKVVPNSNNYTIVDIQDPTHIEKIAGNIAPEHLRDSVDSIVAVLAQRGATRASAPRPRTPPGFSWSSFEGVNVLTHPDYPNYVAVRREGSPTYDLIQLDPREGFAYKIPAADILPRIAKRDHFHKVRLENEQETRERDTAEHASWNNQPGFYVVPGETEDPDGETVGAEGPYHDLEQAIEEAVATQSHLKPTDLQSVLVIESKNPREAAAGRGHVWWKDDTFRGPPIDPRQRGFNF